MIRYLSNSRILAFIAGLLISFAGLYYIFLLVWISLIPLFLALYQKPVKEHVISGVIFGMTIPLVAFTWMIVGAGTFTGGGAIIGLIVLIAFMIISALYWGILLYVLGKIRFLLTGSLILNGLAVTSAWVLIEFVLNIPFAGMPWFSRHIGNTLCGNLYAIQPASLFGEPVLTFMLVLVNYLFAMLLLQRKWKMLILPILLVISFLAVGVVMEQAFTDKKALSPKSFKLAIISENIPPEIKWNDHTGKILVNNLLNLNKIAVGLKPDVVLWSESAIPWTYNPQDDLVNEILRISRPAGITNLIGINTEFSGKKLYNSVYCLLPDSSAAIRYDKCTSLDFIEKPFAGLIVPFFNENGSTVQEGNNPQPLNTPFGKAGVLICNESFIAKSAALMVRNGAEFLVNSSNDGWFRNTTIVQYHFYAARLRAVETRKDVAVNSNNGISGLIQASGRITMAREDKKSYVEQVTVLPNNELTLYTRHPYLWLYWCATCLFGMLCLRFYPEMVKRNIKNKL